MRKKSRVIRTTDDALDQLESIEEAQRISRRRKKKDKIASIEKSRRRVKNRFKEIKSRLDADREFGQ